MTVPPGNANRIAGRDGMLERLQDPAGRRAGFVDSPRAHARASLKRRTPRCIKAPPLQRRLLAEPRSLSRAERGIYPRATREGGRVAVVDRPMTEVAARQLDRSSGPGSSPRLSAEATNSPGLLFEATGPAYSVPDSILFYPSRIALPASGEWILVAMIGDSWGCFTYRMP